MQRWGSGCVFLSVNRGQCGRTGTALLSALRCTGKKIKNENLEYKDRKILYNKISSSHLGISGTECFSEVLSLSDPRVAFYP